MCAIRCDPRSTVNSGMVARIKILPPLSPSHATRSRADGSAMSGSPDSCTLRVDSILRPSVLAALENSSKISSA